MERIRQRLFSGQDMAVVVMNSQQLWLPVQDLPMMEFINIPVQTREGWVRPHSGLRSHWQETAAGEGESFSSVVATGKNLCTVNNLTPCLCKLPQLNLVGRTDTHTHTHGEGVTQSKEEIREGNGDEYNQSKYMKFSRNR